MNENWPELDYQGWADTCSALHRYCQIVGKYRLSHTPWQNHSWHATLYVNARGLTTSLIPDAGGIEIQFDFIDHRLIGRTASGATRALDLGPSSAARFL